VANPALNKEQKLTITKTPNQNPARTWTCILHLGFGVVFVFAVAYCILPVAPVTTNDITAITS
jgi:hypothetical protein